MAAHQFTDSASNVWTINVNLTAARRMRQAGFDLLNITKTSESTRLLMLDDVSLCEALYAVVQPEAIARNVSEEQFLDAMTGQAGQAREVFLTALPDFFDDRTRPLIQEMIAEYETVMATTEPTGERSADTAESSEATAET